VVKAISALNLHGSISISRMIDSIGIAIRESHNDDHRMESEKARLKKLEKEAEKISEAFIDATSAMRSRLNSQLETIEKQIAECKQNIKKIENISADEEVIKERLKAIEAQLLGWIDVSKKSLTRNMVEKLITRITIHMDGVVDVNIKFGNLKRYQLTRRKGHRTTQIDTSGMTIPSQIALRENLRQIHTENETNGLEHTTLNILSFKEALANNPETTIMVNLDT
jgi:prefoldin subunit 5